MDPLPADAPHATAEHAAVVSEDDPTLLDRLADLERRVQTLEGSPPAPQADTAPDAGVVRYSGETRLHGEISWRIGLSVRRTLALDDDPRVGVLAALGHPARARVVRALLDGGPSGTAALQEAADLGSTGQLYHRLRSLTHCGLVEQDARGSYRIPGHAVVPALVLLTAAADVAGQLR